jgi:hypothetical protein
MVACADDGSQCRSTDTANVRAGGGAPNSGFSLNRGRIRSAEWGGPGSTSLLPYAEPSE